MADAPESTTVHPEAEQTTFAFVESGLESVDLPAGMTLATAPMHVLDAARREAYPEDSIQERFTDETKARIQASNEAKARDVARIDAEEKRRLETYVDRAGPWPEAIANRYRGYTNGLYEATLAGYAAFFAGLSQKDARAHRGCHFRSAWSQAPFYLHLGETEPVDQATLDAARDGDMEALEAVHANVREAFPGLASYYAEHYLLELATAHADGPVGVARWLRESILGVPFMPGKAAAEMRERIFRRIHGRGPDEPTVLKRPHRV